jgi:hypothetical protein
MQQHIRSMLHAVARGCTLLLSRLRRKPIDADKLMRQPRACLQWDVNHHSYNFDMSKGPISVEWFKGGQTNITYNCLDRWVSSGQGNRCAGRMRSTSARPLAVAAIATASCPKACTDSLKLA